MTSLAMVNHLLPGGFLMTLAHSSGKSLLNAYDSHLAAKFTSCVCFTVIAPAWSMHMLANTLNIKHPYRMNNTLYNVIRILECNDCFGNLCSLEMDHVVAKQTDNGDRHEDDENEQQWI